MVLKNHLGDGPGKIDALDRVKTRLGMSPQQGEFGRREGGDLGEDLKRNPYFADVMDDASQEDALNAVLGQAHPSRDGGPERRDPALVAGGVGVTHLGRACQGGDGGDQALPQAFVRRLEPDPVAKGRRSERQGVRQFRQQFYFLAVERARLRGIDRQ